MKASYRYITSLSLQHLSEEDLAKLQAEADDWQVKLKWLEAHTPASLWAYELTDQVTPLISQAYHQWSQTHRLKVDPIDLPQGVARIKGLKLRIAR